MSIMSELLLGLQRILKAATVADHGFAFVDVVITRVEQPCTAYDFAQIYPYAVHDDNGDVSARIAIAIYRELVVEQDAVLGLYDLADLVRMYIIGRGEMLAEGCDLSVSRDHDIGERIEPDGQGNAMPTASYITLTIEPEWLEEV